MVLPATGGPAAQLRKRPPLPLQKYCHNPVARTPFKSPFRQRLSSPWPGLGRGRAGIGPACSGRDQKKAKQRVSMLWRGGAPGGDVGSEKAVWMVKRVRPSVAES